MNAAMELAVKDLYKYNKKDLTTAVFKGDFVVHDRGHVIGRLPKDSWIVPEWMK